RPVGTPVDPAMEVAEPIFEAAVVLLPREAVDSRGRLVLEREEGFLESVDGHVMQQGGEPCAPVAACCLSHTIQGVPCIEPALSPGCGRLHRVPLSRSPSLHRLRSQVVPGIVRRFLRYYAIVRLPTGVRAGGTVVDLLRPTRLRAYPSRGARGRKTRGLGALLG